MSKVVVINHVTLDGVMQAPGRAEEDTRDGFTHGGWGNQNVDDQLVVATYARVEEGRPPAATGPPPLRGHAQLLEHPGQPLQRRAQQRAQVRRVADAGGAAPLAELDPPPW